jgi:hypothetical protein
MMKRRPGPILHILHLAGLACEALMTAGSALLVRGGLMPRWARLGFTLSGEF